MHEEMGNVYKILVRKPEWKRPLGNTGIELIIIKMDLKQNVDQIQLVQVRYSGMFL